MRKWIYVVGFLLLSNFVSAQSVGNTNQQSPIPFIIIGGFLLLAMVFVLMSKQKRKHNA